VKRANPPARLPGAKRLCAGASSRMPFGLQMSRSATILLVLAIIAWFASSAVCTSYGKLALQKLSPSSCPLSLTATQFVVATTFGALSWAALKRRAPPWAVARELVFVSITYTMGFILLNSSMGRLQASFSETVRGLEPLTSFGLARLFGARGATVSTASAIALLAVLVGAGVSVSSQPAFDPRGLVLGLCSNVMFSSRALLITKMQDAWKRRSIASDFEEIDSIGLFTMQHALGLLIIVPAALMMEGTQCVVEATTRQHVLHAAGLSALGFYAYNFLSLLVLLVLNAVAHSVCNTCRRAVTILTAAIFFSTPISPMSGVGLVFIIGGSIAYATASSLSKPGAPLAPMKMDEGEERLLDGAAPSKADHSALGGCISDDPSISDTETPLNPPT